MADLTRVPVRWRSEAERAAPCDEAALRSFRADHPEAAVKVFAYSALLTEGGDVVLGRVPARSWREAAVQVALHWSSRPSGQKFGDALLTGQDHSPPDPALAKPKTPGPVTRTVFLFGHDGPGDVLSIKRLQELDQVPTETPP